MNISNDKDFLHGFDFSLVIIVKDVLILLNMIFYYYKSAL